LQQEYRIDRLVRATSAGNNPRQNGACKQRRPIARLALGRDKGEVAPAVLTAIVAV
jgi:hypothetical protein